MSVRFALSLAAPLVLLAAAPAHAGEVFAGIYAHDVDTPLNLRGLNEGVDVQLGWRGDRIGALRAIGSPSPYAFAAVNTAGDMHYAAAGIGWKIGGRVYLRPGIGLAIHTGDVTPRAPQPERAFGSRILFEPEIAVGVELGERVSVEASLVHMSHATLLDGHNPGIDNVGVRLNYRF
jgi:lipid A 3-O-deacylase